MASLTTTQVQLLRRQVGSGITVPELQEIYDRLGDTVEVAREVIEIRLADFKASPATFSVSGEYSQSVADNIRALTTQLVALGTSEDLPLGNVVRSVTPDRSPHR